MTTFSCKNEDICIRFVLPFTPKRIVKTETSENRDLKGDLENGYLKNGIFHV